MSNTQSTVVRSTIVVDAPIERRVHGSPRTSAVGGRPSITFSKRSWPRWSSNPEQVAMSMTVA